MAWSRPISFTLGGSSAPREGQRWKKKPEDRRRRSIRRPQEVKNSEHSVSGTLKECQETLCGRGSRWRLVIASPRSHGSGWHRDVVGLVHLHCFGQALPHHHLHVCDEEGTPHQRQSTIWRLGIEHYLRCWAHEAYFRAGRGAHPQNARRLAPTSSVFAMLFIFDLFQLSNGEIANNGMWFSILQGSSTCLFLLKTKGSELSSASYLCRPTAGSVQELLESHLWSTGGHIVVAVGLRLGCSASVMRVDLSQNDDLGLEGLQAITEAMQLNVTLRELTLRAVRALDESGARCLAETLRKNRVLRKLDVRGNSMGDEGTKALIEAARVSSIEELHIFELRPFEYHKMDPNQALAQVLVGRFSQD
eukprot:g8492.t1